MTSVISGTEAETGMAGVSTDRVPGWSGSSGSSGEVFKDSLKGLTFLAGIYLGPFRYCG